MIYVNQKQLDQVEYLIEQSCRGHHVLFDMNMIREAFKRAAALPENDKSEEDDEESESTEKHIENLILQPTLVSKKAYLDNLSEETRDKVVRTYFSIVENNIFESQQFSQ